MAYPRFQLARNFKYIVDNSTVSGYNVTQSSFSELATVSGALDMTIFANVDDVIEFTASLYWEDKASDRSIDVAVLEAGSATPSIVDFFANGSYGIPSLHARNGSGGVGKSCVIHYTVPDIAIYDGTITIRPVAKVSSGTAYVLATLQHPLGISIKNLGPQEV